MEIASSAFRNEASAPIVCEHSTLFLSMLALGPIQETFFQAIIKKIAP